MGEGANMEEANGDGVDAEPNINALDISEERGQDPDGIFDEIFGEVSHEAVDTTVGQVHGNLPHRAR